MTVQLSARNASPQDLVTILQSQQAAKLDVVAPADKIKSRHGELVVANTVAELTDEGVTTAAGTYRTTDVFDDGIAGRLRIPRDYYRRMRTEGRTDLLDANVNGWLHGRSRREADGTLTTVHEPDSRAFLLRLFRGSDGGPGIARAILSDRYGLSMDNLDILMAVQKGITAAGEQPVVRVSDLSERHMRVRFEFPNLYQDAPGLLEGYTSPFEGGKIRRAGTRDLEALREQFGPNHIFNNKDAPLAYLGIDLDNSETGGGAYSLVPVIGMVKCTNGWVMLREGIRKIHRGAVLAEGVVKPSLETIQAAGKLITSETADAVRQWLTPEYLAALVTSVEEKAAVRITRPTEVVPAVCSGLGFSPEETEGVLNMFIMSGMPTAGGVAQAVSAYAQTVQNVDRAFDLERQAMAALDAAAAA